MANSDEIVVLRGRRHVVTECGECGVVYTVPEVRHDHMRSEGGFACCQNGHRWGWDKDGSERERLRRERDRLAQQIAMEQDRVREAERSAFVAGEALIAAEKRETRLKRRIVGGACPCCNRTFSNVGRHMKTKHPAFMAEVVTLKAVG